MSDQLPLEMQAEIMKRLPVKSLIQSKLVSKPWKSLIESSEFVKDYNLSQTSPHHLFIRYDDPYEKSEELKYVSIDDNDDDDNTFLQSKFAPALPESFKILNRKPQLVGSSHGLLCFYGEYPYGPGGSYPNNISELAIIWNPSINKSIAINILVLCDYFSSIISFGVRPDTCDPMIVKINDRQHIVSWQFEVFKLSTGIWRVQRNNLPRKSIQFTDCYVSVDGFIYWKTYDKSANLIVSFDMKSEKFAEISLPDHLASKSFSISKLRESLAVIEYHKEAEKRDCTIWIMMMMRDHGVQNSFKKLYTVSAPDASLKRIPGFRKCGKPIVQTTTDDQEESWQLQSYEPRSKSINGLGIHGKHPYFFVSSYTETLLLLNHPENHGKPVQFKFVNER